MSDKIKIQIVLGVEGPSVYINEYRVAGRKPWGGGKIAYEFLAAVSDVNEALKPHNYVLTTRAALGDEK